MENKKELYRSIAGLIITTGLSMATSGSSNILLSTFSGLIGGKAGKFIDEIDFKKIKNIFKKNDISDLNSDLQDIVFESVEFAIKNVQLVYSRKLSSSEQKKELIDFNNSILYELNSISKKIIKSNLSLYKVIDNPSSKSEFLETLDFDVSKFPIIKSDAPYKDFFKENFSDNLRLYFGELLKQEKNKKSYITYQREIFKSIDDNFEVLISQNRKILNEIETKEVKKRIHNVIVGDEISEEFESSINNELLYIKKRIDLLVDVTSDIKSDTTIIKSLIKDFDKELQGNWISKNKITVSVLISFFAIIIIFLVFKLNNSPFQMNLGVEFDSTVNIHSEYPEISNKARLRIYFPNETKEKEISYSNEALFTELNPNLLRMKCKIQLIDKYWITSEDSIVIKKGNTLISIRPNNSLSKIRGNVADIYGKPISNATISVDSISSLTTKNGTFLITIPIDLRRMNYNISVKKNGFAPKKLEYISGSDISIRLKRYSN